MNNGQVHVQGTRYMYMYMSNHVGSTLHVHIKRKNEEQEEMNKHRNSQ